MSTQRHRWPFQPEAESVFEEENPARIEFEGPGLGAVLESEPLLARQVGLQVGGLARRGRAMEPEVERDLMRGFAGLNQPAGEAIDSARFMHEAEMM